MSAHTDARFVQRARALMGLSPDAFGERLGVTRQTVWRYEKGDPVKRSVKIAINALLAEQGHDKTVKRSVKVAIKALLAEHGKRVTP